MYKRLVLGSGKGLVKDNRFLKTNTVGGSVSLCSNFFVVLSRNINLTFDYKCFLRKNSCCHS